MKTIRVGNANNRTVWTLLLIAGLGGLYLYQRRGGKVSTLLQSGLSGVTAARERIGQIAPSVTNAVGGVMGSKSNSGMNTQTSDITTATV